MTDIHAVPSFPERLGNVIRITGTIVTVPVALAFIVGAAAIYFHTPSDDVLLEARRTQWNNEGMELYAKIILVAWVGSRVADYLLTGRKPWPLNRSERPQ